MSAMPSPAQSEFYAGLLSVEPSVKAPAIRPTALENDPSLITQQSLRKRASRALARFLITFCIGVAAALAWQSYATRPDKSSRARTRSLAGWHRTPNRLRRTPLT